jgi:hypothetical protein
MRSNGGDRSRAATAALGIKDGPGPRAEDLLKLAAIYALLTGARVHVLDCARIPDNEDTPAVFRY